MVWLKYVCNSCLSHNFSCRISTFSYGSLYTLCPGSVAPRVDMKYYLSRSIHIRAILYLSLNSVLNTILNWWLLWFVAFFSHILHRIPYICSFFTKSMKYIPVSARICPITAIAEYEFPQNRRSMLVYESISQFFTAVTWLRLLICCQRESAHEND